MEQNTSTPQPAENKTPITESVIHEDKPQRFREVHGIGYATVSETVVIIPVHQPSQIRLELPA